MVHWWELGHSSRNLDLLLLLATKPSWTVSGKPLQSRLIHRHTTFFGSGLFLNLKFKDLEQSSPHFVQHNPMSFLKKLPASTGRGDSGARGCTIAQGKFTLYAYVKGNYALTIF